MRYAIVLLSLGLAACAGGGGSSGQVSIATAEGGQPLDGARCTVTHNTQSWEVVTPATLAVGSPEGDLSVRCEKPGYRSSELRVSPSAGRRGGGPSVGLGLGGFGGGGASVIGSSVGLSLPLGGSGGAGRYPAEVTVHMTREAASAAEPAAPVQAPAAPAN